MDDGASGGPALGGALVASLVVSVAMVGFELNTEHVTPKLERISPAAGLKRLFSVRPLVEMAKALVVMGVVAVLVWSEVEEAGPEALRAAWLEGTAGLSHARGAARRRWRPGSRGCCWCWESRTTRWRGRGTSRT